ncbi:MAG: DUF3277 family protein [Deltaproteobacteria bacterium]|nr:DUF3277 family protein [Deltaproteobacteria bacterium]
MQPLAYDPKKVASNFIGNIITGYAKDKKIKVSFAEDTWSLYVGCDGDFTRVVNRNESGEITISLAASSPSNDVLAAAWALDKQTGQGSGAFNVEDFNGTSLFGAVAWVKKLPDLERGKELGENEWVLSFGKPNVVFLGGNYST